jgi:hypothetical protein
MHPLQSLRSLEPVAEDSRIRVAGLSGATCGLQQAVILRRPVHATSPTKGRHLGAPVTGVRYQLTVGP